MLWILIALINPIAHGACNILDNFLTNKIFKSVWAIIFYELLLEVIFLPLLFLIQRPALPSISLLPVFLLIGLTEAFYLYPYYKALQNDDTSVVASLFALSNILTPILAFLLVKETLAPLQYIGFGMIVICSTALTWNTGKKFHLNKSFWYMLLSCLILAPQAVLYKYVFEHTTWATGFTWGTIASFGVGALFILLTGKLNKLGLDIKSFKKHAGLFIGNGFLGFLGSAAGELAISLVPVTFEKSVDSFQPFFVLLYAIVLKRFYPNIFKEAVDKKQVFKKMFLFAFMALGMILVVR